MIDTKLERRRYESYLGAWSAVSTDERRRIINENVASSVTHFDTIARLNGRDHLSAHLDGFQQRRPGYSFTLEKLSSASQCGSGELEYEGRDRKGRSSRIRCRQLRRLRAFVEHCRLL